MFICTDITKNPVFKLNRYRDNNEIRLKLRTAIQILTNTNLN
jgi:hypothetical protein